jgi:hypothetical protein
VRLLAVDPDLGRHLNEEERSEVAGVMLPARRIPTGRLDVGELLGRANAFAAIIVDGMVLGRLHVGDQSGLRILGPGEVIWPRSPARPQLLAHADHSAACETTLAMLGNDWLIATHRWPRLIPGLHARMAESAERVATQLMICQLSRVEDRVLSMLWLLAEQWGRVTPAGTSLPMSLTHELLGALVGARRPTVSLALRELAQRGAAFPQDRGWLLLERPAAAAWSPAPPDLPRMLGDSRWDALPGPAGRASDREVLDGTLLRLRAQHAHWVQEVGDSVVRAQRARRDSQELHRRIRAARKLRTRPPPSS